jgi:hypothetical protein
MSFELIFYLSCLLSILEVVHNLIKFAQHQDVFIIEFVDVVKLVEVELFKLYIDPYSCFKDSTFDAFNAQLFLGWRSNYAHPQEILEFCEG